MARLRVLELRIHGIANAPPADMLCTTQERVERKDGDEEGSFWQIKPTPGAPDTSPEHVEIVAEAYSWGNQARSGGSAIALIGRAIVHVGWLFVLPFGLCNLAYWARRDIKGTDEAPNWWAGGNGAIAVRMFALLQTLFYVVGFLTVSVYLIGLQCVREEPPGKKVFTTCAALPGWLDFLTGLSPTSRAAVLSVVPIAIILLIYLIGRTARGNFNPQRSFDDPKQEPAAGEGAKGASAAAPPRPPLLATADFWHRARIVQTSERTHFAGAIALIVFLLAADTLLDANPNSSPIDLLLRFGTTFAEHPIPAVMTAIGGALLLSAFAITALIGLSDKIWSNSSKRGWSTVLLVLSALAYAFWLGWAVLVARDDVEGAGQYPGDAEFRGLIVTPTVIAALGAVIAVASLAWGYRWRHVVMWVLLPLAFLSVVWSELGAKNVLGEAPWLRPALSWTAVALVIGALIVAYVPFRNAEVREARRLSGWHGNGAAVALLLALFSSLVITSLLVLGAHSWLTADNDAPEVANGRRTIEPAAAASIDPPAFYERFAGMLVIMLVALILVAVLATIAALRRYPAFSLPGLTVPEGTTPERKADDEYLGGTTVLTDDYPANEVKPSGRLRAVADARRVASLAHRGEPMMLMLAILTAIALVPLAIPYFGEMIDGKVFVPGDAPSAGVEPLAVWSTLSSISGWALGLLAIAAIAWVVTNAVTSTERPLGLVWDIICFFPRVGHPFTPPCYAERAVPEVSKRVKRWIKEGGEDARVILSAHSMGATIAVGAVFWLHNDTNDDTLNRVSLLTHGAQLRAYFSRYFPEVFGPRVLGVRGTTAPALLAADPWKRQVIGDRLRPTSALQPAGDPLTVVKLLGGDFGDVDHLVAPRWRSLWRRTDFLGFPITGYWSNEKNGVNGNPIDRGATERSPRDYLWKVARHNDYLSTLQYQAARDELIEMMEGKRPFRKLTAVSRKLIRGSAGRAR